MKPVPYSKRTDPWIPVGHPQYVWTTSADVQATWRRYGWRPIAEVDAERAAKEIFSLPRLQTSQL
jgi:hypothetical protein